MSGQLMRAIRQHLSALEQTQDELSALLKRKRSALINARADELGRIAGAEEQLANRLKAHLTCRRRILQQAQEQGTPSDSILNLVVQIGGDDREQLERRIERARVAAEQIRRLGWVDWIVAQRALRQHNELLELIAHCGEKAPTYSNQPSKETAGGAILDTSV